MNIQEFLRLPFVIGVGPIRSGTTWLDEILRIHPEIQLPHNIKELHFFSEKLEKGIEWYASHFIPFDSKARVWGEISPSYISCTECPRRIRSILPNVKIIISLRNLYDLVISMYGLYIKYGGEKIGLYRFVNSDAIKKLSWGLDVKIFSKYIIRYFSVFDKKNIYLMLYDDLISSPYELARKIYQFISVSDMYTTASVGHRIHGMMLPRNRILAKLAAKAVRILRHRFEFNYIADKAKKSSIVRKLLYSSDLSKLEVSSDGKTKAFQYLYPSFNKEIDYLEKITGRSLQHWKYHP